MRTIITLLAITFLSACTNNHSPDFVNGSGDIVGNLRYVDPHECCTIYN